MTEEIKRCSNCKFGSRELDDEPCNTCGADYNDLIDYRNWESKEDEKMKNCLNCFYEYVVINIEKYPCIDCCKGLGEYNTLKWKAKKQNEAKENICFECVRNNRSDCPFYNLEVEGCFNENGEPCVSFGEGKKIIRKIKTKPKTIKLCSSFESQASQDYIDTASSMSEALKEKGFEPNHFTYDTDLKEHEIIGRATTSVKKNDKKQQFWAEVDLYDEEGKCYNKDNKKIKRGNSMNEIEQEIEKKQKKIEKVKKLIENEEKKRNERIEEIQELIKKENLSHKNGNMWVSREFIDYIIEKEDLCIKKKKKRSKSKFKDICIILNSLSLKIKEYGYNIEYGKNPFDFKSKELIKTSRDDWNKIEEAFLLIEKYADEYILNTYQKKLCFLTDCYKKLATEKFCKKCASSNPIEAIYCNHCGEKL